MIWGPSNARKPVCRYLLYSIEWQKSCLYFCPYPQYCRLVAAVLSWGPDKGAQVTENSWLKNRAVPKLENGYVIIRMVPTSFTFSMPSASSVPILLLKITELPRFFLTVTCGKKFLKPSPHHKVFGIIFGNMRGKSGRKSRNICRRYVFSSHHHCGHTLLYLLGHAPRRHWLGWLLYVGSLVSFISTLGSPLGQW